MSGLDNELCPFCGGDRIEVIKDPRPQWVNWYVAVCIVRDPCGAIGPARRTKAEAIAAWNTRATLRQPAPDAGDMQGLVERLLAFICGDHERGCEARNASCSCGFDDSHVDATREAAAAIQSLTAQLADERAKVAELVIMLTDCAADIEGEVEAKRGSVLARTTDRDLIIVRQARALIEKMTAP